MKLYGLAGACSLTDHIALRWVGAPFELELLDRNRLKSDEYLAINPLGSVPALVDGDVVVTQNVAILFYLDERFPDALLFGGRDAASRAQAMSWLAFCNSDLHKAFIPLFAPAAFGADEHNSALKEAAISQLTRLFGVVEQRLTGRDYLSGQRSVADAYLFVTLRWAQAFELACAQTPALKAFFERMMSDEAVVQALQQEGLI